MGLVNTTMPYAWDDSLSVYEMLGKLISKINEVVGLVNEKLPDDFETAFYETFREYTRDEMQRIIDSGEFATIIDSMIVEFLPVKQEVIDARQGALSLGANITEVKSQLTHIAYVLNVSDLVNNNITQKLQELIDSIKTTDHTEGVPTNTVLGEIKIPPGKFIINQTIKIPSNIKISGAGKNNTVLISEIIDGTPVLHVAGGSINGKNQFFHNSFNGFTIFGDNKNCIGLRLDNCSRWSMTDLMITETQGEGLYLYESYLGDVFGLLVRACGDSTRYSVTHDGRDSNNGTHAVTYIGGEIAGAPSSLKTIKGGLGIVYGMSNSLIGMTIEGFNKGYGVVEENAVSTLITGCYFELNEGNILSLNTEGCNYVNNFMTLRCCRFRL